MITEDLQIGVFDSGMGGLTVLRELKKALPNESFIYLGDTARLPYGTKSVKTVEHYATQMARILVEREIKALVIACNTATTAALPHLREMLPEIPVIGVVEPGARASIKATRNNAIAVIATETTIKTNQYQKLILAKIANAKIRTQSCPLLVALAEEGMVDNIIAREAFKHYLRDFDKEDTLLLGCTHFPVFKSLLKSILPPHVTIVDSAEETAKALVPVLSNRGLLKQTNTKTQTSYLVTDSIERFSKIGKIFLGNEITPEDIELVDASGQ